MDIIYDGTYYRHIVLPGGLNLHIPFAGLDGILRLKEDIENTMMIVNLYGYEMQFGEKKLSDYRCYNFKKNNEFICSIYVAAVSRWVERYKKSFILLEGGMTYNKLSSDGRVYNNRRDGKEFIQVRIGEDLSAPWRKVQEVLI